MSTENIQEIELTRKYLKTAKELHRLARAKNLPIFVQIILFWFCVGWFIVNSGKIGILISIGIPNTNFWFLLFYIGYEIFLIWAILELFKMRKTLNKYNLKQKGNQ